MKKILILSVSVLVLFSAWRERFVLRKFFGRKVPALGSAIQNNLLSDSAVSAAADFASQVITGGALRSGENDPDASLTDNGVLEQTNKNRADNGLGALLINDRLSAAAAAKLKDMFDKQYFEHKSPQGKGPADLAKSAGYGFIVIGENLALGNFKNDQALVDAWMNSPGHRANILNKRFNQIGIAVGRGKYEGKTVWMAVQEFGKPVSDCPTVDQALKAGIDVLNLQLSGTAKQLSIQKKELDSRQPQTSDEYDEYNRQVGEYNDQVHIYNNQLDVLKQDAALYNAQVKDFNSCAK